jgi:uncharacterized protein (DUF58 family)
MLAVMASVTLGGALFGIQELYGLAAAAGLLVAASAAWVGARRWELGSNRWVRPARIPAGRAARVDLGLRNVSARSSPVLAVRDRFADGDRWTEFLVAPLGPGEVSTASYRLPATRRGVFSVGPLELEVADPFGLVRQVRMGAAPTTLIVYPRTDRIGVPTAWSGSDRRGTDGSPVLALNGDEFYALREYQEGDDLRRVHWASTARLGKVMIRQEEALWRGRLTVAVDLRAPLWRPASFEIALSAAASVADAGLRTHLHVRLVTSSGTDTGFGSSSPHRAVILEELAAATPDRSDGLGTLLARLRNAENGILVVVTSDQARDGDLVALTRVSRRSLPVMVVVDRDAGEAGRSVPRALPALTARVVRVGEDGFRRAWERWVGAHDPALSGT